VIVAVDEPPPPAPAFIASSDSPNKARRLCSAAVWSRLEWRLREEVEEVLPLVGVMAM
jgi:hypothetical protein